MYSRTCRGSLISGFAEFSVIWAKSSRILSIFSFDCIIILICSNSIKQTMSVEMIRSDWNWFSTPHSKWAEMFSEEVFHFLCSFRLVDYCSRSLEFFIRSWVLPQRKKFKNNTSLRGDIAFFYRDLLWIKIYF